MNHIGLDTEKSEVLATRLNELLANYQLHYQNLRGFHWNVKGQQFFELHLKFEELYNDAVIKVDEIAERILTLGSTPFHTFSQYLRSSTVKEQNDLTDGPECLAAVLTDMKVLLELEREILDLASDANDEGTNTLMSDYISKQEKVVWMLNAYLS